MTDLTDPFGHIYELSAQLESHKTEFVDVHHDVGSFRALETDMDSTFEQFVKGSHNGDLLELDSSLLLKRANVSTERATNQVRSANHELDVSDFLGALTQYKDRRNFDSTQLIRKLGRVVIAQSSQAFGWLCDPICEPEERRAITRRRFARSDAELVRPLAQSLEQSTDQVKELVTEMYSRLEAYYDGANEPLDLFRVILNAQDFGQTVENIYALSLLVSARRVTIYNSGSDLPLVKLSAGGRRTECDRNQFVFTMNYDQWRQLGRHYTGAPFMPDRGTGPTAT